MNELGSRMRCLELYSGIGGFHYALKDREICADVCAVVDINTTANAVYKHNFPKTKVLQRNIESFTVEEIDKFNVDLIWMSPPCQPFTRVGKQRDCNDKRTFSFLHILKLLPCLKKKPKYILLENVKGFELSETRLQLISVLCENEYSYQEFLLTPQQFSIPNSRLRYYVIAKLKPLSFSFDTSPEVMHLIPMKKESCPSPGDITGSFEDKLSMECQSVSTRHNATPLKNYLEDQPWNYFEKYLIPDKIILKFANLLDIVNENMPNSCCFTKAYTHYAEGTGSVLHGDLNISVSDIYSAASCIVNDDPKKLHLLKSLKLRYFTPREIANILGFPAEFSFPECTNTQQQYRLLGNSLNVKVVSELLMLCLNTCN